jgi:Zn-dependent protease with chaperone function
MEEDKTIVEVLVERAQAYIKTSVQLFKLRATDKVAETASKFVTGFVITVFLSLFLININIGIALLIGYILGKAWLGFIILSLFYFFGGIIVYIFRNRLIKRPVMNAVIKQLLKEGTFT